jgi:hypothetical protein
MLKEGGRTGTSPKWLERAPLPQNDEVMQKLRHDERLLEIPSDES